MGEESATKTGVHSPPSNGKAVQALSQVSKSNSSLKHWHERYRCVEHSVVVRIETRRTSVYRLTMESVVKPTILMI